MVIWFKTFNTYLTFSFETPEVVFIVVVNKNIYTLNSSEKMFRYKIVHVQNINVPKWPVENVSKFKKLKNKQLNNYNKYNYNSIFKNIVIYFILVYYLTIHTYDIIIVVYNLECFLYLFIILFLLNKSICIIFKVMFLSKFNIYIIYIIFIKI